MIKRAAVNLWSGLEGMWSGMINDSAWVPVVLFVPVVIVLVGWGLTAT